MDEMSKNGGVNCTRVIWVPFVLSPVYSIFLLQNWPFTLRNVVFWELGKAIVGTEKDKWWIWGS